MIRNLVALISLFLVACVASCSSGAARKPLLCVVIGLERLEAERFYVDMLDGVAQRIDVDVGSNNYYSPEGETIAIVVKAATAEGEDVFAAYTQKAADKASVSLSRIPPAAWMTCAEKKIHLEPVLIGGH